MNSVVRFQASGSLLLIINSATARIVVLRIRLWRRVGLFAEIGSMQHEKKGFDRTGAAGSAGFLAGL
jgi:hypothetical protein